MFLDQIITPDARRRALAPRHTKPLRAPTDLDLLFRSKIVTLNTFNSKGLVNHDLHSHRLTC